MFIKITSDNTQNKTTKHNNHTQTIKHFFFQKTKQLPIEQYAHFHTPTNQHVLIKNITSTRTKHYTQDKLNYIILKLREHRSYALLVYFQPTYCKQIKSIYL